MRAVTIASALGALALGLLPRGASAQGESFTSRRALDASYDKQRQALIDDFQKKVNELEGRRLADLGKLAERQEGDRAEATYRHLFNEAIVANRFDAAAPAAERYLKSDKGDRKLYALATYVKSIAEADRGDYEKSLDDLRAFLKRHPAKEREQKLDARTIFSLGEALLERLMNAGHYAEARKVADLFLEGDPDPAVKAHFESRRDRLAMLGKPAPPIQAKDVDGESFNLADMKGKVVLVDFWATWCPPCIASIPALSALYSRYHDKGFEIVGVNVDGAREGARGDAVMPAVRRFLIDRAVPWWNVQNGEGDSDFAKAYGVTEIPATFLVDRDGKVIRVESTPEALDQALAKALGDEKKGQADRSR